MSYKKELDEMVWSFSRMQRYIDCPYSFYLKYIEGQDEENNFYAENGKLIHEILSEIITKKTTIEDGIERYISEFDFIFSDVKNSIRENTFDKCLEYLCSINYGMLEEYEILECEKRFTIKIGEYNFQGYIDLLLKNKNTNKIILLDHKSLPHMFKKNGEVLKSQQSQFEKCSRQMYIYSKYIKEEYGEFPDLICWNHFKDNGIISVMNFSEDEYNETILNVIDTISEIYRDEYFTEKISYMMCSQLCGYRNTCDLKEGDDDE